MTRKEVFNLIDEERQYQDDLPHHQDKEQQRKTPVAAWVIYMKKLLREAEDRIYFMDEQTALEYIRKCTAVGVACMEYNDTPARINPYREGSE